MTRLVLAVMLVGGVIATSGCSHDCKTSDAVGNVSQPAPERGGGGGGHGGGGEGGGAHGDGGAHDSDSSGSSGAHDSDVHVVPSWVPFIGHDDCKDNR